MCNSAILLLLVFFILIQPTASAEKKSGRPVTMTFGDAYDRVDYAAVQSMTDCPITFKSKAEYRTGILIEVNAERAAANSIGGPSVIAERLWLN